MGKRVDIDVGDLERLFAVLHYAIEKTRESDPVFSGYLREEFEEVKGHIENEHKGAEIAQEIDMILDFIGGSG